MIMIQGKSTHEQVTNTPFTLLFYGKNLYICIEPQHAITVKL
jgi:hypothetical protein